MLGSLMKMNVQCQLGKVKGLVMSTSVSLRKFPVTQ